MSWAFGLSAGLVIYTLYAGEQLSLSHAFIFLVCVLVYACFYNPGKKSKEWQEARRVGSDLVRCDG